MGEGRRQPSGRAALYPKRAKPAAGWPRMPAPPPFERPRAATPPKKVAPFVDNGREALEVLARLAGGTTFKDPGIGRASRISLGTDDVAHALGRVKDPLDQRLALALACQTAAEWQAIQELAHEPLLRDLQGSQKTRALVAGARRFRARMVLHIVFHDLALLRPSQPWAEGAQVLRMRRQDYQALYEATRGFIVTRAGAAAHKACRFLFGKG